MLPENEFPIVIEVKKRYWHLYSLSVFNLPLSAFLAYLDGEMIIRHAELLVEKTDRQLEEVSREDLDTIHSLSNFLVGVLEPIQSIHLDLPGEFSIDSNLTDELHLKYMEISDVHHLLARMFPTQYGVIGRPVFLDPMSLCFEWYQGQLHAYGSLSQYLQLKGS